MSQMNGFAISQFRRPFLHDQYAALSHKGYLGDGAGGTTTIRPLGTPSWVADEDARRLAAYELLAAYRDNVTRYYLPTLDQAVSEEWRKLREYGHAQLLIKQARALLLGRSQEIVVPDAQGTDEDDDAPADLDATTRTGDLPPSDVDPSKAHAEPFAEWLEQWAEDEHLILKLLEGEENSIALGDNVYVLGWDTLRKRPRLRVFDPGFYFPELAENADDLGGDDADLFGHTAMATDDDFPKAIHIAYEYLGRDGRAKLRRFTWRLALPDQAIDGAGSMSAVMPWAPQESDDNETPTLTCLYSDRTYDVSRLTGGQKVYNITSDPESSRANDLDLGIDFLPIVHMPNDAAGSRHFGQSLITSVAQVLDDAASNDTDLNENSTLVGSTPVVVKGGAGADLRSGPGSQWNLPPGSDVTMLDTSKNLDALLKQGQNLSTILSTNSRVASALLGRVSPEKVPSGYALELGFAPTVALIGEMRAVRHIKYALLLKFAMRMAQAYQVLPAGPTPAAFIELGPYLPSDVQLAVDIVQKLLTEHAISTETAVLILRNAGLPIEDVDDEIGRIQAEAFEAAIALADATGDDVAVRARLRLPPKPPEPPAPPPAPAAPGTPTAPTPGGGYPADTAPAPTLRPLPPRQLRGE